MTTATSSMSTANMLGRLAAPNEQEVPFLDRLRAGDDLAYEAFVREYTGRMLVVARRFLACSDDCADAVQEGICLRLPGDRDFRGKV